MTKDTSNVVRLDDFRQKASLRSKNERQRVGLSGDELQALERLIARIETITRVKIQKTIQTSYTCAEIILRACDAGVDFTPLRILKLPNQEGEGFIFYAQRSGVQINRRTGLEWLIPDIEFSYKDADQTEDPGRPVKVAPDPIANKLEDGFKGTFTDEEIECVKRCIASTGLVFLEEDAASESQGHSICLVHQDRVQFPLMVMIVKYKKEGRNEPSFTMVGVLGYGNKPDMLVEGLDDLPAMLNQARLYVLRNSTRSLNGSTIKLVHPLDLRFE